MWSYIIQAHLDNGTEVELFRKEGIYFVLEAHKKVYFGGK